MSGDAPPPGGTGASGAAPAPGGTGASGEAPPPGGSGGSGAAPPPGGTGASGDAPPPGGIGGSGAAPAPGGAGASGASPALGGTGAIGATTTPGGTGAIGATTAPGGTGAGGASPDGTGGGGDAPPPGGNAELVRYYDDAAIVEEDGAYRLDYKRAPKSPPPPATIRSLQAQIGDVERVVNVLFSNDVPRKERFFKELHLAAWSGFIGQDYSVEISLDNLQDIKNHIADTYPQIRQPIWIANLKFLIGSIICNIAAFSALRYFTGHNLPDLGNTLWNDIVISCFLIPLGCAAGLFAEFLFRVNDDIPYDQLRAINPGRWNPWYRAINTVLVAYIFAGLLAGDILQVGLGGTLLNLFKQGRPELSLAIGFVTGFAFPYVRDLLQQVRPERRQGTN